MRQHNIHGHIHRMTKVWYPHMDISMDISISTAILQKSLGVRDWQAGKNTSSGKIGKNEHAHSVRFSRTTFFNLGRPGDVGRHPDEEIGTCTYVYYLQRFYYVRFSRPGNSDDTVDNLDAKVGVCSHGIKMNGAKRLSTVWRKRLAYT